MAPGRKPIISFESKWGGDFDPKPAPRRHERRPKPKAKAKATTPRSLLLAYLLWLILGLAGAHRFYLRRYVTGFLFLALFLTQGYLPEESAAMTVATLLLVLWIIDAFRLPSMVRKLNPPEPPEKEELIGTRSAAAVLSSSSPSSSSPSSSSSSSSSSSPLASVKAEDVLRTAAELGELAEAVGMEELGTTMKVGSQALAAATGKRLETGRGLFGGRSLASLRHGGGEPRRTSGKMGGDEAAPQDVLAAIEKLHALYQAGALKKDEFEREKKELLRKL